MKSQIVSDIISACLGDYFLNWSPEWIATLSLFVVLKALTYKIEIKIDLDLPSTGIQMKKSFYSFSMNFSLTFRLLHFQETSPARFKLERQLNLIQIFLINSRQLFDFSSVGDIFMR